MEKQYKHLTMVERDKITELRYEGALSRLHQKMSALIVIVSADNFQQTFLKLLKFACTKYRSIKPLLPINLTFTSLAFEIVRIISRLTGYSALSIMVPLWKRSRSFPLPLPVKPTRFPSIRKARDSPLVINIQLSFSN